MKLFLQIMFILCLPNEYSLQKTNFQGHRSNTTFLKTGKVSARIIGGEEATPHSYPFMAKLEMVIMWFTISTCGGTLISTSWILTSAHCLDNTSGLPFVMMVTLGAHNTNKEESSKVVLETVKYIIHPYFDRRTLRHDIALIKLKQPIVLNKYIGIVAYEKTRKKHVGHKCISLGWGHTSQYHILGPVTYSDTLKIINTQILSNKECSSYFPKGSITKDHICMSGAGNIGGCSGDSGGPTLINGVQVGVVSFVLAKEDIMCVLGTPTVSIIISHYQDFIEETMAGRRYGASGNIHGPVIILLLVYLFTLVL